MEIGVFIPIGNNGWLVSKNSPQYIPTFDLNKAIVVSAESFGFDFALSMIKLRGYGGETKHWDYNLESFTLMAGLAAVTTKIRLFASIAVLTMPPAIAARMAVTIDSISHGRFGVNIVSGWQMAEYSQMGIWPGESYYARRYEYCSEYARIMKDLWETGRSDFKGEFFQMDDCRLLPQPETRVPIICAAQSDAGTRFAVENCDYNFCSSYGVNEPTKFAPSMARLVDMNRETGKDVGGLVLVMIIADETDEGAMAKWEHYRSGADLEALAWWRGQAKADPSKDPFATPNRMKLRGDDTYPTNQGVLVGSYASVAGMLDEMAAVPGVSGVMLTFDDFLEGINRFGEHIQPIMRSRPAMRKLVSASPSHVT